MWYLMPMNYWHIKYLDAKKLVFAWSFLHVFLYSVILSLGYITQNMYNLAEIYKMITYSSNANSIANT